MSQHDSPIKTLLLRLRLPTFLLALVVIVLSVANMAADKDLIVVATLNGEDITRGKLTKVLRDLPDVDRPLIQNKGDLIRALNAYIDGEIKQSYAKILEAEGKIKRQRPPATAQYFQKYPDQMEMANVIQNFSLGERNALLAEIEYGIDAEEDLILREQALVFIIRQAIQEGTLSASDEEFQREYERETLLNPSAYQHFEYVVFDAIRFNQDSPGLGQAGALVTRILDQGESFETLINSFEKIEPSRVMRAAEMGNDPASSRFDTFWNEVSGTEVGDVRGPVVIPSYKTIRRGPSGESLEETVPDSYLVLVVRDHTAPRAKTWEEARAELSTPIYIRKMMDRLRTRHGVELFPDNLPNPAGFGDQFKNSTISMGK